MNKLLIRHKNTPNDLIKCFESGDLIEFEYKNNNFHGLDGYISKEIIPKLEKKDFDILFIKDKLSSNYLELYGIYLIYHIRMSLELGKKRFVPIIILSDIDIHVLYRINNILKIVFTKNIFIAPNNIKTINQYCDKKLTSLSDKDYFDKFFNIIDILKYDIKSSDHDISNEWSIYRWAEFLKINNETINKNKNKIEELLYFKYLKIKYPIPKKFNLIIPKSPKSIGNILYVDDEWEKGWGDIFNKYFSRSENIKYNILDLNYKNCTYSEIEIRLKEKINNISCDLIILDVRLLKNDHYEKNENNLTGIKLLYFIKSYNPGIQIILLTASEKSTVLEIVHNKIVGYIKKESPKDNSSYTKKVFKKLSNYIDIGLENKYLKDIWIIQEEILKFNIFKQEKYNQIKLEVNSIFEVLDTNMKNKFIYSMFSIFKSIELIIGFYIEEKLENKKRFAYWKSTNIKVNILKKEEYLPRIIKSDENNDSTLNKIRMILYEKLSLQDKKSHEDLINLINIRNNTIHPKHDNIEKIDEQSILKWFNILFKILNKIDKT